MDFGQKLLDRETLKNLLALTVAGRLKRAVENQVIDSFFKTDALKKKFQESQLRIYLY